jgi:hypothetical protein
MCVVDGATGALQQLRADHPLQLLQLQAQGPLADMALLSGLPEAGQPRDGDEVLEIAEVIGVPEESTDPLHKPILHAYSISRIWREEEESDRPEQTRTSDLAAAIRQFVVRQKRQKRH